MPEADNCDTSGLWCGMTGSGWTNCAVSLNDSSLRSARCLALPSVAVWLALSSSQFRADARGYHEASVAIQATQPDPTPFSCGFMAITCGRATCSLLALSDKARSDDQLTYDQQHITAFPASQCAQLY